MSITPHLFRRVLELLGYLVRCWGFQSVWFGTIAKLGAHFHEAL